MSVLDWSYVLARSTVHLLLNTYPFLVNLLFIEVLWGFVFVFVLSGCENSI